MRSSKAIASAHPISWPSELHLGRRRQVCHLLPMVIAMLTPELASEYAWRSMSSLGPGIGRDRSGELRVVVHHLRSFAVSHGAW